MTLLPATPKNAYQPTALAVCLALKTTPVRTPKRTVRTNDATLAAHVLARHLT